MGNTGTSVGSCGTGISSWLGLSNTEALSGMVDASMLKDGGGGDTAVIASSSSGQVPIALHFSALYQEAILSETTVTDCFMSSNTPPPRRRRWFRR